MKQPDLDPANTPYRQTPEYAAAVERASRDRRRMRYRTALLSSGERVIEAAARDRKLHI